MVTDLKTLLEKVNMFIWDKDNILLKRCNTVLEYLETETITNKKKRNENR